MFSSCYKFLSGNIDIVIPNHLSDQLPGVYYTKSDCAYTSEVAIEKCSESFKTQ